MTVAEIHELHQAAVGAEEAGNVEQAIAGFRHVLRLDPSSSAARRSLALLLVRAGRSGEAFEHARVEVAAGEEGVAWLTDEVVRAMQADDLRPAGELAGLLSSVRYGPDADSAFPEPTLSLGKLRHDAEQLRHLRSLGVFDVEMDRVIDGLDDIGTRVESMGTEARLPLSSVDDERIRDVYGRIIHVRATPRLAQALSDSWDPEVVQDAYLNGRPSVVVIDDFLTRDALESLQRFCLESTVWLGNRYPLGRLGAFIFSGFNCPLLLQLAEELRTAFSRVIGTRHTLRQLWGFKYPAHLPRDSTIHADFAAVNVNFWITPERVNLEPASGGLVVYDITAPRSWDFDAYNRRLDLIKDFLTENRPRAINIPYRENRAVIFDSDLFHATAEANFLPGYVNQRINITMLYGVREGDHDHAPVHAVARPAVVPPWRSAALTSTRRSR